ncbi:hypothetical protein A5893_17170 [Pedobacter psychrophilus]|uniref:Uncharacterized protein n=1 Tax=Pedobacter psychrophilus TaxID=1826909 RepID=A0A179DQZ1_9SPHI|nr:hypothetical protein [Pedobacter psychrophilus]OAQ43517.1 hypothetical protein A5893_17170 [Pedobacter psychrophilus]
MKTLKLFNSVVLKETDEKPFISEQGFIIEPGALWAKKEILNFYKNEKLDGYGLNKTFHKSWKTIFSSSRTDLLIEQIRHYISTYGSEFEDEIYIPNEVLEIPNTKVVFKVVKSYPKEVIIEKCLQLLQSGIALKEETINDVLSILVDELDYKFTGNENIKNKEAVIKIADMYGIIPNDILEFFRFIIYRTTGESLLIKSKEVIEAIKASNYNPAIQFEKFGLEKLAEIFNRFKPLFLAFKTKCPKAINKIAKLSKVHHKPLVSNPLNYVTSIILNQEDDLHWLNNATSFALFRAISACHSRIQGQYAFAYRIRNGKSFIKTNKVSGAAWSNYEFLINYCKQRFTLNGKRFFLPPDVEYALPTSEKMFVGNIPTGSKFFGETLAIGVYWENQWGAHDIDLSGLNIGGKVGWNSEYKQGNGELMYSGDITDAPNGAVEYLYAKNGLNEPTLINSNVYSGQGNCEYKIVAGKGDQIDYNFMMNPNHLFLETKCQSVQNQTILGILIPVNNRQSFVILNFGAGQCRVSGNSEITITATKALFQQWSNPISLREVLIAFGGEIVNEKENADYNLSLDNLQKDSFIKIFKQ